MFINTMPFALNFKKDHMYVREIRDGLNANIFHITEIWDLTSALDQI